MLEVRSTADVRRTILFVFGAARSGTSAVTRALSLCGAALPPGMLGADRTNQRGYWEPRESIYLNRKILQRHGSAWWKPGILDVKSFDARDRLAALSSIKAYLAELPSAPMVVIKDPHIVPLAELWFEAARNAGFHVAVVIAVRHPNEVIDSLQAVTGIEPELASALWLKASLLAEKETRCFPRVFVDYAALLEDWRREVKRVAVELDLELDWPDERAIDEFLTPDLRHHRGGPIPDRFGAKWISKAYDVMYAAAQDQPVNTGALDRTFEQYLASEHDFRLVFEADRRYSAKTVTRLLKPVVLKWVMDVRATAHRRKGTWS